MIGGIRQISRAWRRRSAAWNRRQPWSTDWRAGVEAGRDTSEMPAVILLDLKLPKVNGLEVLKRLCSHDLTKRLPVVILTSSREAQDMAMSYDLGAKRSIRKPFDFHQFAAAVRALDWYWLVLNQPLPLA
jgi:two-component system, response regulator